MYIWVINIIIIILQFLKMSGQKIKINYLLIWITIMWYYKYYYHN